MICEYLFALSVRMSGILLIELFKYSLNSIWFEARQSIPFIQSSRERKGERERERREREREGRERERESGEQNQERDRMARAEKRHSGEMTALIQLISFEIINLLRTYNRNIIVQEQYCYFRSLTYYTTNHFNYTHIYEIVAACTLIASVLPQGKLKCLIHIAFTIIYVTCINFREIS